DDQIARWSAAVAGLALALEPDLRPVLDPGRDLHLVPLRAPLASGPVAARARLLDHGAAAVAARARVREAEEPLALGDHAAAATLRADDRRGARLRAGAAALAARRVELDRDLRLDALERVLEREGDARLDVGAAAGRLTRAAAEHVTEASEQIGDVAEV